MQGSTSKKVTRYQLNVYYDLVSDPIHQRLVFRDNEIKKIAGVKSVASGYHTNEGIRDVQLEFDTRLTMLEAKVKLQAAGFSSFCKME